MKKILILLAMGILLLSCVNAYEFDNVRSFDRNVGNYGKYEITNAFGLGKRIADLELKENTDVCYENCEAIKEVTIYNDGSLIDDIAFYRLVGSTRAETNILDYSFSIRNNGVWIPYKIGETVKAGTYEVRLEGTKYPSEAIDWVVKSNGIWTTEWAAWGAIYEYYDTGDDSGLSVYGSEFHAQTFTVGTVGSDIAYEIEGMTVKVYKVGTLANPAYFNIYAVNASGDPDISGGILSNGTLPTAGIPDAAAWYNVTMSSFNVTPSTKYAIEMNSSGGDNGNKWRWAYDSGGATYAGGDPYRTVTGGVKWEAPLAGTDAMFVLWGQTPLSVNQISPANGETFSSRTINLNCTSTGLATAEIQNISLYHNATGTWEYNQTQIRTGVTNSSYFSVLFSEDSNITWGCRACNVNGYCAYTPSNQTFVIDTINPLVTLTQPNVSLIKIRSTTSLNWTTSDTNLGSCWYEYNNSNSTVTCADLNTTFLTNSSAKSITFYVNDTANNLNSSAKSWEYYDTQFNSSTNASTEGNHITFRLRVNTTAASIPTTTAVLYWNNTQYAADSVVADADKYVFTKAVTVDAGLGNSTGRNISWYWDYYIESNINTTTPSSIVNIRSLALDNCSIYSDEIYNFTLRDESSNSIIAGSSGTQIEIHTIVTSWTDSSKTWNYSVEMINVSEARICVPSALLSATDSYRIDTTVRFNSSNRIVEFYHIQNDTLNSTYNKNISLMDLGTSESTSFLLTLKDEYEDNLEEVVAKLFRYYVGGGIYRAVEASLTDNNGETDLNLIEEDEIYYLEVWEQGRKLWTTDTFKALCTTSPICEIEFTQSRTEVDDQIDKFWNWGNGVYYFSANKTARMVYLKYISETAGTANLTLFLLSANQSEADEAVNSSSSTATETTLSVYVPTVFGNKTYYAVFFYNGVQIASRWVDLGIDPEDYFRTTAVIMVAFLVITLAMALISQGEWMIAFTVFGLLISGVLGLLKIPIGALMGIVLVAAIIMIKLGQRRR